MATRIITADASKVTPSEFLSGFLGLPSREERYAADLERVIRKIEVGASLYGIPPVTVADASKLIAERAALTDKVEAELRHEMSRRAA